MGNAYANDIQAPTSAQILIGDFCFYAGLPDQELVKNIPGDFPSETLFMIPQNNEWENLIEQEYKTNAHRFMRYAIKKEPGRFDTAKLHTYVAGLLPEYHISGIDEEVYKKISNREGLKYLCSQFPTYNDFEQKGLGFVILHKDKPVSGASSYTIYDKGIEIEIDTIEIYRRKGLALACASRLILECLDRGLYPSWDAANKESAALAEKLGYHFDKEYVTYAISNFRYT